MEELRRIIARMTADLDERRLRLIIAFIRGIITK